MPLWLLTLLTPHIANAQGTIGRLVGNFNEVIINPLIRLLIACGVVYFIYGVVMFIANLDNETKRKEGKSHMFWGMVGVFIMVAVFGILNFIIRTVN